MASVADPYNFDTDSDPGIEKKFVTDPNQDQNWISVRIRIQAKTIRIRIQAKKKLVPAYQEFEENLKNLTKKLISGALCIYFI